MENNIDMEKNCEVNMNIAVYCGSGYGTNEAFVEAARELGEWIGKAGHTLVYGGGESGLMGEVSKSAKACGARVIGVLPGDVDFIANRPQPYCDEVIRAKNMSERKATMLDLADAFVALPGGIGTLDEISEAITLTKIGVFDKKAFLINREGFWENFRMMMKTMVDCDFMTESDTAKVFFVESASQINFTS